MNRILLILIFLLLVAFNTTNGFSQYHSDNLWQDVDATLIDYGNERLIMLQHYRLLSVDLNDIRQILNQAPLEFTEMAKIKEILLTLPTPDGMFQQFRILESPIMEPELAAKFPQMKTYSGQGIDDRTSTCRISITPERFHAILFTLQGTVYIDPYSKNDITIYISYFKHHAQWSVDRGAAPEPCILQFDALIAQQISTLIEQGVVEATGAELRTYRAAIAATGEYTQFHGGAVFKGMQAVLEVMNRVNGIYEREVAIRMILVSNNDQIIYTDPSTDPYTNSVPEIMLQENQDNIDNVIGDSNYDIGHVFGTGNGGAAILGVVCRSEQKAQGVSGLSSPIGDPFYVDYVAHEIGHQFGANHTFNGNAGGCGFFNQRNPATVYEPGSGSTIMAYAGLCGSQNLQANSHDYFHRISIDEIVAYSTESYGNNCPTIILTGNSPPTVNAGPSGYTIPINTPFILTGSGSDPDGDALTFCWEQYDLGPAGHPNYPSGNAPIFRSFPPESSPTRTFPQLSDL